MKPICSPWAPLFAVSALVAALAAVPPSFAVPVSNSFTYQGQLKNNGAPVSGQRDFLVTLYDQANSASGVGQIGSPVQLNCQNVAGGLFTLTLAFPDLTANNCQGRWLEIAVRPCGGTAFQTLGPRVELLPTPYALQSVNACTVEANGVGSAALQNGAVTSAKIADGTIASTKVNAASFGTVFWKADGNAGTVPGTHFVGTSDNQPLELKVNGTRSLRLEPHGAGAASLIGGYFQNTVGNAGGATIAGGGTSGAINMAVGDYAFIGAGIGGRAGNSAVVGGGAYNSALGSFSLLGGGIANTNLGDYGVLAGGQNNLIGGPFTHSTISGGLGNRAGAVGATVGGGSTNVAAGPYATVPGGQFNTASGLDSFAAGFRAKATNIGSFVWADSQNADFTSTANDQFSIRAAGGVRMFGAGLISTGTGNGVQGLSANVNASGVYGQNTSFGYGIAGRSPWIAVYGESATSTGYGGYFVGKLVVVNGALTGSTFDRTAEQFTVVGPGDLEIGLQNADPFGRRWTLQNTRASSSFGTPGASIWEGCFQIIDRTAGKSRLSILVDGRVGLGTIEPSRNLEVQSAGDVEIGLKSTDAGGHLWTLQSSGDWANTLGKFQIIDRTLGLSRQTIDLQGNAGIGTTEPRAKLDISTSGSPLSGSVLSPTLLATAADLPAPVGSDTTLASFALKAGNEVSLGVHARRNNAANGWPAVGLGLTFDVDNSREAGGGLWLVPDGSFGHGNVGIGTATPAARLEVADGDILMTGGRTLRSTGRLHIQAAEDLFLNPWSGVTHVGGGAENTGNLIVHGSADVCSLHVRGGCDLAEPFEVSDRDLPKGSLVIIDDEQEGKLKQAASEYDTRVAGIVSGANGINPGIRLQQDGAFDHGQDVALSGRVYALADATSAPIKPGDLLTSSATPGHVMKVTDPARAQGAIVGKAMSALKNGKGMVLVLVSLQ